jgi:type II secretory ATPase GspE/PulE/Tfp pilus assembly ATPase PilB-like protein
MLRSLALHVAMVLLALVMLHGAAARKAPAEMTVTHTLAETGPRGLSSTAAFRGSLRASRRTPSSILPRHGWQVRGFSLRENALVRGANGHVQRKPGPGILVGVMPRGQRISLVAAQSLLRPTLGFRGPGNYLSLPNLLISWLLFALWIWTVDWVNRDCLLVRQNYAVWNLVLFVPFLLALLLTLSPIGIPFVAGLIVMVVVYLASAGTYLYVRNAAVPAHQRVLTPDHLRHLVTGGEKKAAYEKGAQVDLTPQGGASDRENSANLLLARQSPGYVMVKNLIADAIKERGDAVMLDLTPEATDVRYQVDGVWHNNESQDREVGDLIVEVLKTLSARDKNERRKKQIGEFKAALDGEKYTMHLACQATQTGERVVLRFDHGRHPFHDLEELGMRDKIREKFLDVLGADKGFVLFSSLPRGGLTTMTDVSLGETDRLLRNFVAIERENQRELEIQNVEVTTYNRAAGETPATVLPALIRTYPDVIVVRNLRDAETLKILCRQIEENRLVIGTIQGKNSVDALLRVLAIKVPADEFAPVVSGVIYSRLVRKLCSACRVGYEPTADVLKKLGIPKGRAETFYREPNADEIDKVCTKCGGIGYLGRTGIFELLVVDDGVRQALRRSPRYDRVRKVARAAGMRSLQEEGILLVIKGVTSLPEVMRVLKK